MVKLSLWVAISGVGAVFLLPNASYAFKKKAKTKEASEEQEIILT